MKKSKVKQLILLIFIISCLWSDVFSAGAKEYCSDRWEGDYVMQEHCMNKQYKGLDKLYDLAESKHLLGADGKIDFAIGDDYIEIVSLCLNKWKVTKFNTFDMAMVAYCVEKQFEAYDRIQ